MHSLFLIETGELTGLQMVADADLLARNAPPGFAWVEGSHDARRCIVEMVADEAGAVRPVVVPRVPPRPADTELQTWQWDEAAADWRAHPTAALMRRQADLAARARRDELLASSDWVVTRAAEAGEPVPAAWRTYRQALRDITAQPTFPEAIAWPSLPSS